MNDHSKSKRRMHWLWWLLGAVVVLAVGTFLGVWWYNVTGMRMLKDRMAEARADGGPVTWEEIVAAQPTIPDEENAALVILELAPRMEEINKTVLQKRSRYYQLFKQLYPPLGHRWPEKSHELASMALREFDSEFDRIDDLVDYEACVFSIELKPDPLAIDFGPLGEMSTLRNLVALRAMHQVFDGDPSRLNLQLKLLSTLSRTSTPILIGALGACGCDGSAVQITEHALAQFEMSPDMLRGLKQQIEALDTDHGLLTGMRGERATFIGVCEWFKAQGSPTGVVGIKSVLYANLPMFDGWWARDVASGIGMWNAIVDAAKAPAQVNQIERLISEIEANILAAKEEGQVLTPMLIPSLGRAFAIERVTTARIRCCQVGLALERYRIDHQAFPETLDALVPDYMDAVPMDVTVDQPLLYRRDPDRAVVYSVGWDGTDDGGPDETDYVSCDHKDWGFTVLDPSRRGLPPVPEEEEGADTGP